MPQYAFPDPDQIAALYVRRFGDAVALESVKELENLTTGLSGKIWQKLMIVASARTSS